MVHGSVVPGKALHHFPLVGAALHSGKSVGVVFKLHGVEPNVSQLLLTVKVESEWMLIVEDAHLEDCTVPVLHVDALDFALITVESYHLDGEGVLSAEQKGMATMSSYAEVSGPDALIDECKMLLHC